MSDTYQPKVYRTDGGDKQVVASGGELAVEAGGKISLANAAAMDAPQFMKVASGALAAGNANAFAFAWQNPEAVKIFVHRVIVDVTTAGGTGSSVIDVGSGATATTASDNLIDGMDADATGPRDNVQDQGTNGKSRQKMDENGGTTDYITGQILVANAAALAGKYYIFYTAVA